MVELYPDALLASTNITGDVTALRNNDTTTFWAPTDADSLWSARVSVDDPSAALSGQQTTVVLFDFFNGTDQTYFIELWEAGTAVATLASGTAPGTGLHTITVTWDGGAVGNGADVQLRTGISAVGSGMPGTRANARLGYVTWDAQLLAPFVTVTTLAAENITADGFDARMDLDWFGSSLSYWWEYGVLGNGLPNSTAPTTITQTGASTQTQPITGLAADTTYEVRAHASRDDGAETASGSIVTVTTAPEPPAAPTGLAADFVG